MMFPQEVQQQCDDLMSLLNETCFPISSQSVESVGSRESHLADMAATFRATLGLEAEAVFAAIEASARHGKPGCTQSGPSRTAFAIPLLLRSGENTEAKWFAVGRLHCDTNHGLRLLNVAHQANVRQMKLLAQNEQLVHAYNELTTTQRDHHQLRLSTQKFLAADRIESNSEVIFNSLEPISDLLQADCIALLNIKEAKSFEYTEPYPSVVVGSVRHNLEHLQQIIREHSLSTNLDEVIVVDDKSAFRHLNSNGAPPIDNVALSPVVIEGECQAVLAVVNSGGSERDSSGTAFGARETGLLQEASILIATQLNNRRVLAESEQLVMGTLRAMSRAIEARDPYTRGHSERVGRLGFYLARKLKLSEQECQEVYLSGLLHDIGKIGIPDEILLKPGRLTPGEISIIREHPKIGHEILEQLDKLRFALPGVLHHHEQWNGEGYPHQLAGEDTPLMARILSVADAFDAMASSRPYRNAMEIAKVRQIISHGSGLQWDAMVADTFLHWLDEREIPDTTSSEDPIGLLPSSSDWFCNTENFPTSV